MKGKRGPGNSHVSLQREQKKVAVLQTGGHSLPLPLLGNMSFWRNFGFYTVSSIETTLNKPDFTLEDLLDDEEILQEVKAQNKKLIDVYVP
jgi:hypothetical protein